MRYEITRHLLVESDIENIQDFIAEFAGLASAERKSFEIERTFEQHQDFPHIGTVRNEIVPGLHALPSADKAVICVTINDETKTVKIVCVTYAGQDWQKIARTRQ